MWQASGLVVRVAGRAFVRMLEEADMCTPKATGLGLVPKASQFQRFKAWHSLLGGVSATLCSAVGVSGWLDAGCVHPATDTTSSRSRLFRF